MAGDREKQSAEERIFLFIDSLIDPSPVAGKYRTSTHHEK